MSEKRRSAEIFIDSTELLQLMGIDPETHRIVWVGGYDSPDDADGIDVFVEGPTMPKEIEPTAEDIANGDDAPLSETITLSDLRARIGGKS